MADLKVVAEAGWAAKFLFEATPLVRRLLETPRVGHAVLWLVERGAALPDQLGSMISFAPLVDEVAVACEDGPGDVLAAFDGSTTGRRLRSTLAGGRARDAPRARDTRRRLPGHARRRVARKAAIRDRRWTAGRPR
jgi:hypothetical protein